MKQQIKIFLIVFLFPLYLFAQPEPGENNELAGLWQGYLTTTDKKLPYELVISEKDGKLFGYSYTTFTVNKEEIVSLKKVKIHWQNRSIIVEDDNLLFDNFTSDAPKKIVQTNTLFFKKDVKPYQLTGMFDSKATRTYRAARGSIFLEKKQVDTITKLIAKLDEMQLSSSLSFSLTPQVAKPTKDSSIAVVKKPAPPIVVAKPAILPDTAKTTPAVVIKNPATAPTPTTTKPPAESKAIAKTTPIPVITKQPASVKSPATAKPAPAPTVAKVNSTPPVNIPAATKPVVKNIAVAPVLDISDRKIETIQQLYIQDDSLQLTLYDNGIIDGDSISLILNGKTIVSKLMLNTIPFTQTIYLTPDLGDTIQLVMYAENLGSLPPNTGLLILQYDKERHEIRFSGDLTKNAAITLRRKEKTE